MKPTHRVHCPDCAEGGNETPSERDHVGVASHGAVDNRGTTHNDQVAEGGSAQSDGQHDQPDRNRRRSELGSATDVGRDKQDKEVAEAARTQVGHVERSRSRAAESGQVDHHLAV